MKRQKILYVIDSLQYGGTELQLKGLIDRLDRNRFAPHLCTIRPTEVSLTPDDCPHLAWDLPRLISPGGVSAIWRLSRYLRNKNFSIVQTFFQDATVVGGLAARLAGTPMRLASFRDLGFWRTPAQKVLLHGVYPLMTGFLANADVVRANFAEHDNIKKDAIDVIYNGIDVNNLHWVEQTGPTLHIGIVGNLNRRVKRTDLFLKAAGIVGRRHPEITWHILGDGHLRPEFEALAQSEGIGDRTIFTGNIRGVADYLAKLQVAVLCSDSEGFSNALLEYMLRGCAAVATRVGGNPEAITTGETGILVPPSDVIALAEALQELIADVSLRQELARNARHEAVSRFGWDHCVAAHEVIYDSAQNE
jgi:glycosyltransferase involved in cell wall biosynthesis